LCLGNNTGVFIMNYLIRHLTRILFISSFFILSFYYSVGTANAAAVIDATPYGLTRIYYANGIADLQADQEIMSVDTLLSRWVVKKGSELAASNYSIISSTATPSSSDGFFGYLVLQVIRNDDNSTFTVNQQYGSGEYNLTHTYTCPSGYNHVKADGSAGDSHDAYCAIADTCSSKSGQSVYASVSYSNAPTQICVSSCLATRKVSVSFGDLPSSTTLWQGMTFKYTGASCSGDSNTAGQEYKTQAEADALNATAKQQAAYTAAVTKCGGADYVSTGTVNGATTYTCKSTDSKTNSSTTTTATLAANFSSTWAQSFDALPTGFQFFPETSLLENYRFWNKSSNNQIRAIRRFKTTVHVGKPKRFVFKFKKRTFRFEDYSQGTFLTEGFAAGKSIGFAIKCHGERGQVCGVKSTVNQPILTELGTPVMWKFREHYFYRWVAGNNRPTIYGSNLGSGETVDEGALGWVGVPALKAQRYAGSNDVAAGYPQWGALDFTSKHEAMINPVDDCTGNPYNPVVVTS